MTHAAAPEPIPLIAAEEAGALDPLIQQEHVPAPATAQNIGPGSRLLILIPDAGTFACTANFVWAAGGRYYLGAAGHCFLPPGKRATHGPGADYDASRVRVSVCLQACNFGGQTGFFIGGGASRTLGSVAYARQNGVGDDFGLVEIPADQYAFVRTTLPVWGGPVSASPAPASGTVCVYGNGVIVGEAFPTMARIGVGNGGDPAAGSWQAILPSNSGDSGAAVVTCGSDGGGLHGLRPVGILTHGIGFGGVGVPAMAFGTTIAKAKTMATQASLDIELALSV